VNYIRHLTGFFERAAKDHRLNPTHISLYMSIFQLWNVNRFKNPISLSRSELMELSKVSSKTTYHKCMKELQQLGYLRYDPSYHPLRGSWVHLFDFNGVKESDQSKNCPGTGLVLDKQWTGDGQVVYQSASETDDSKRFPSPLNMYKHSKHSKLSFRQPAKNLKNKKREKNEIADEKNNFSFELEKIPPVHSSNSNSAANTAAENFFTAPSEVSFEKIPESKTQVIQFFLESGYDESHAVKFFLYNSATGWKIAGKSPIENWRAAALSWMLNPQNNNKNGKSIKPETNADRLHTISDKNYSEPL
jgi:hypothetical protein